MRIELEIDEDTVMRLLILLAPALFAIISAIVLNMVLVRGQLP